MLDHPPPRWRVVVAAAVAASALGAPALCAQATTGAITGRVTDAASGVPVAAAQIQIVGSNRGAQSGTEGTFALRGLPAGNYTVRVLRIGYVEQSRTVAVAAGQTVALNFSLRAAAVTLAPVVATATGDQRRVEVGNSIATIQAANLVADRPVANMSDLLVARTPGVQVLGGNATGAGQRIRIRGASSISLSNEPIVFIDGMRMTSDNNSSSIGVGGTSPSRLSDINPEEIESIEVAKGPSAATLYGTDATNGVIVIRTKRGRVGATQWSAYAERGAVTDLNKYPDAFYGWTSRSPTGARSTTSNNVQCFASQVSRGLCTQDSLTVYNLWEDDSVSPLTTGPRQQYGLNARGGSESIRYFASGEWEDEVGQYRMPEVMGQRLLEARGLSALPRAQEFPNALRRVTSRANIDVIATPKLDFNVSSGFISSSQRLPQLDNNTGGLQSNAFGGPGFRGNTRPGDNVALYGFRIYPADEIFSRTNSQAVNRWLGSGLMNVRPTSWLSGRVGGGLDYTNRVDSDLCRRGQCYALGTLPTGYAADNRSNFFNYTGDGSLTATRNFGGLQLESRTTGGMQYVRSYFNRNGGNIENLPAGGTTIGQGSTNPQLSSVTTESKTLGFYLQQQFFWRDALFVTAAVRSDRNSSFGADFPWITYPKGEVSWVASKESFFPRIPGLDQLRLRGAIGRSGRQPGTTDAARFYDVSTAADVTGDQPALIFFALGNADLKPAITQEIETGFEAQFLNNRLSVDATYYSKTTRDDLVSRTVAPSVGAAATVFDNIGSVKNAGFELLVNTVLVDRPQFGFDLTVNGTLNDNKLVSLGRVPPIIGATRRQLPGYPLNGLWQRPLQSFADANGDGIITVNEIVVGDTAVFLGREDPRTMIQFTPTVRLLRGKLRVTANVDRQANFFRLNGTERIRCESRNNCLGAVNPRAPLFEQARAVAVREHPSRTQGGYMERADFVRWRELSVSVDLPTRLARAVRGSAATLRVAGRNLGVWTDYTGIDPEANYFEGALGTISDFQTAPPPSLFTARVDLRF